MKLKHLATAAQSTSAGRVASGLVWFVALLVVFFIGVFVGQLAMAAYLMR